MNRFQDRKIDHLRDVPMFRHCSPAQLRRIAAVVDRIEVGDGYQLCAEGTVGRELFIVRSGTVDVVSGGTTIATVGPGEVLGEISLVGRRRRTASAVTRGDVSVYVVSRLNVTTLLEQTPGLTQTLLRTVCDRVLGTAAPVG